MQDMDQQARVVAATNVIREVEKTSKFENAQYRMTVDGPEIKVVDVTTGLTAAFSSMRADFDASLEEFAWDFFTGYGEA